MNRFSGKYRPHFWVKLIVAGSFFLASCTPAAKVTGTRDDGKITIQFLQVNDVYEIAPIENGHAGGMARLAYLKDSLVMRNNNTLLIMAGDFLSPSVFNTLQYNGERVRGRQMVEAMNAAGTNIAVFGNHEFDITEGELQQRINESEFDWISTNSFHKTAKGKEPFVKKTAYSSIPFPETMIRTFRDADGTSVRIGFIGINIPFNAAPYVVYADPLKSAIAAYRKISDSCDAVIALTHQAEPDDIKLAEALPKLAAIIGGHEHDNRHLKVGNVTISKAHANARSAYLIEVNINKNTDKVSVSDKLIMITDAMKEQAKTKAVVDKWTAIAEKNLSSLGFDANRILLRSGEPLEARESVVRSGSSNFTRLMVKAMEAAAPEADLAIINSGSVRVDDVLQPPIKEYDILRTLPFGGGITEVNMRGSLLKKILEAGRQNHGTGGWLQKSAALVFDEMEQLWIFKKVIVQDDQVFRVAMPDFLLTGGEANMGFLTKNNRDILKVFPKAAAPDPRSDLRTAIIKYLLSH